MLTTKKNFKNLILKKILYSYRGSSFVHIICSILFFVMINTYS